MKGIRDDFFVKLVDAIFEAADHDNSIIDEIDSEENKKYSMMANEGVVRIEQMIGKARLELGKKKQENYAGILQMLMQMSEEVFSKVSNQFTPNYSGQLALSFHRKLQTEKDIEGLKGDTILAELLDGIQTTENLEAFLNDETTEEDR